MNLALAPLCEAEINLAVEVVRRDGGLDARWYFRWKPYHGCAEDPL